MVPGYGDDVGLVIRFEFNVNSYRRVHKFIKLLELLESQDWAAILAVGDESFD